MIDIHNHLIFGVDDGPSEIKESLAMLSEAERIGINAIIATPHYHKGLFNSSKIKENFKELAGRAKDCSIRLYLGYEVFMGHRMLPIFYSKEDLTLGNSKYLLFELPFDSVPVYSKEVLCDLNLRGITPIIAHPERYRKFVNSFELFISFIEGGCLVQVDAASIAGVYGIEVKSFTKKLIKLGLVNFVASDAHCADDYKWYTAARKQVKRWGGEECAERLFYRNPQIILE